MDVEKKASKKYNLEGKYSVNLAELQYSQMILVRKDVLPDKNNLFEQSEAEVNAIIRGEFPCINKLSVSFSDTGSSVVTRKLIIRFVPRKYSQPEVDVYIKSILNKAPQRTVYQTID